MDIYEITRQLRSGKSIFDLNLRVTYYARVSTDTDEQAHSLKNQVEYYRKFITDVGQWTFVDGYVDEGISGTSVRKRGSFLKMIDDAKLNKFDFIVTKEISRFSRNTLDSIKYTQDLLSHGVGVLFQSDNINTLLPDSELRLTIMSSIAQDEVRKTSERVRFGFKRAIENGVVLGSNKIWGYRKDNGRLVIHEEEAKVVRLIFELYATQNMGIRAISGYLTEHGYKNKEGNPLSFSTIKGILINPKYCGNYCGNKTQKLDYRRNDIKYLDKSEWVIYKDEEKVPPIVSEELWEKANAILSVRSAKMSSANKTSYQNKYPYSGKIVCMKHGDFYHRAMYRYKSGNREVWQCRRYGEKGRAGCDSPAIYTDELNMVIKKSYNMIIQNKPQIMNDMIKIYSSVSDASKINQNTAKLQLEADRIFTMKDKLLQLSINGRISDEEFQSRNDRFNAKIEEIKQKTEALKMHETKNREVIHNIETLGKIISGELEFEEGFDNTIVDSMLERIEVCSTGDRKKIRLRVYFKALKDGMGFQIIRARGAPSVCYELYI